MEIVIREYDALGDCERVESLERRCEVGPSGETCLLTDSMGDPLCRVRHSSFFLMLVAEVRSVGREREIVGVVRGCIKTMTCGKKKKKNTDDDDDDEKKKIVVPVLTKAAYVLGLRVSPSHRRLGIALSLVTRLESWFRLNGAEYAYMATEKTNYASINLFTRRLNYSKFRTPAILVHPVHAHRKRLPSSVRIIQLSAAEAEMLYRSRLAAVEFFPNDIDAVLRHHLTIGSLLAVPSSSLVRCFGDFLESPPSSWAAVSMWNTGGVFKLQVNGVNPVKVAASRASRILDRVMPWMCIPSMPEIFRPFGCLFLYGIAGEGPAAIGLLRVLCKRAHNIGGECGAGVVAAEVASCEPLREGVPHWGMLSCEEDLWCIKRLSNRNSGEEVSGSDWTKSPPGRSIFVDPREL